MIQEGIGANFSERPCIACKIMRLTLVAPDSESPLEIIIKAER
jgi:hypothetical protein